MKLSLLYFKNIIAMFLYCDNQDRPVIFRRMLGRYHEKLLQSFCRKFIMHTETDKA